jgi:hypothetical protein
MFQRLAIFAGSLRHVHSSKPGYMGQTPYCRVSTVSTFPMLFSSLGRCARAVLDAAHCRYRDRASRSGPTTAECSWTRWLHVPQFLAPFLTCKTAASRGASSGFSFDVASSTASAAAGWRIGRAGSFVIPRSLPRNSSYHGSCPSFACVNVPVGPSGPSNATRTASAAPSSTVSVPA